MTIEIFHDQSLGKYGAGLGSLTTPVSDSLPIALWGPASLRFFSVVTFILYFFLQKKISLFFSQDIIRKSR